MTKQHPRLKDYLVSILVAFFLAADLTVFESQSILPAYLNLYSLILLILLFAASLFLSFKSNQIEYSKKNNYYIFFSAILIGLITALGQGYSINQSWSVYFSNFTGLIMLLIRGIGFSLLTFPILKISLKILIDKRYLNIKDLNWRPSIFKLFLLVFLPKLLAMLIFFPGNLDYNSQNSLMEYYSLNGQGEAVDSFSSGNPWLAVKYIGFFSEIGNFLGNSNLGFILMALVQTVLFSLAFALILYQLIRWRSPKWLTIGILVIYSIAPVWLMASVYLIKDVTYFGLLAIWYIIFIRVVDRHLLSIISASGFTFLSALLILFRTSSAFIILPGFLIILWYLSRGLRTRFKGGAISVIIGIPVLIMLLLTFGSKNFQAEFFNKYPNIAIQQIARTFANNQQEINPQIASDLKPIVNLQTADKLYQARIVDPILTETDHKAFNQQFGDQANRVFWSNWRTLFRQFPADFIQAFFGLNYQYYYPLNVEKIDSSSDAVWSIDVQSDVWQTRSQLLNKLNYHYLLSTNFRFQVSKILKAIDNFPILSWLTGGGIYGVILLFIFGYSILNRKSTLVISGIPLILIWLLNLNAPINGLVRYNLPILAILPLYLGYFSYKINSLK